MGLTSFLTSLLAWAILVFFIAVIVMGIMSFFLNFYYTDPISSDSTPIQELENIAKESKFKRNLFIAIVVILAISVIAASLSGMIDVSI